MAKSASGRDSWHAVSVVAGNTACAAVQQLLGKRFLPVEAPRLPIGTCDLQAQCACKYKHHADRRTAQRRSGTPKPGASAPVPVKERRRPGERRERHG